MELITVWTKQSNKILNTLEQFGRHTVKKEYIVEKMEDHSQLYLDCYTWLVNESKKHMEIPQDVRFPVWVSLKEEEIILNTKNDGTVILELEVPKDNLMTFDIDKWGAIVNYQYIAKDKQDKEQHMKMLENYGLDDDSSAYMSNFYPALKQQIQKSWQRLFDDSVKLSAMDVGVLWEVKKEWVKKIYQ